MLHEHHLKRPKFQERKLGAGWIALPLALLGSIFIVPLVLGARVLLRRLRPAG